MKSIGESRWAAYAAFVWMVSSVVWHIGMGVVADDDVADGGPWGYTAYIAYDSLIIIMSIVGAVLCLATVRPWGDRLSRRTVLAPIAIGSVLLIVRGVPGLIENIFVLTGITPRGFLGVVDDSVETPSTTEVWQGVAINAYFFVGAILLVPATINYFRRTRAAVRVEEDVTG
ncbi:hypothetical protein [Streptomyces sp. H39-S7]|uniref:hypothetical protein n=1 Tax=Streptomyces sp. H39-S7 TaxID=3004357 RepID=UPI0022B04CC9|nr:hypothetical protein [Streptomyces sp. H39-S7]MCZ4125422.1 hypothetical protein [Streptomyces sp. H39-S7]